MIVRFIKGPKLLPCSSTAAPENLTAACGLTD